MVRKRMVSLPVTIEPPAIPPGLSHDPLHFSGAQAPCGKFGAKTSVVNVEFISTACSGDGEHARCSSV
jgi:hypothetical protein